MRSLSTSDFAEIYRKFSPMVLRRCRALLKDEDKAVDAMQDVFIKIMEQNSKINNICASYFYVTATHICLNKIRAEKIRSGTNFDAVSETLICENSSTEENKVDTTILLQKIFADRDEKDKLIATLHYVDGYTLEETAKLMEMSVSGIQKRLNGLKKHAASYKD